MEDYSQKLLDAYLDGEMTPEMEQEFVSWLRQDRENVRRFVRITHLHRGIRDLLLADKSLTRIRRDEQALWQRKIIGFPLEKIAAVAAMAVLCAAALLALSLTPTQNTGNGSINRENSNESNTVAVNYPVPIKSPQVYADIGVGGKDLYTETEPGELTLGGYCHLRLEPDTRLQVQGEPGREEVFLLHGSLVCEVDRKVGRFTVRTEAGSAEVTGTKFRVQAGDTSEKWRGLLWAGLSRQEKSSAPFTIRRAWMMVGVIEGSVAVASRKTGEVCSLRATEELTLEAEFLPLPQAPGRYAREPSAMKSWSGAPLAEVCTWLSKTFEMKFTCAEELSKLPLHLISLHADARSMTGEIAALVGAEADWENGTCRFSALKQPSPLISDDFRTLANWNALVVPQPQSGKLSVEAFRLEKTDDYAGASLTLDCASLGDASLGAMLKLPLEVPAFSVEYDVLLEKFYVAPGRSASVIFFHPASPDGLKSKREIVFSSFEQIGSLEKPVWLHYRAEVRRLPGGDGKEMFDISEYLGGKLFQRVRIRVETSGFCALLTKRVKARIGGFSVRYLPTEQ
jgi:hypothetical protein